MRQAWTTAIGGMAMLVAGCDGPWAGPVDWGVPPDDDDLGWHGADPHDPPVVIDTIPDPSGSLDPGWFVDSDGDGTVDAADCAPDDPTIHPGAEDLACDDIDRDCDGHLGIRIRVPEDVSSIQAAIDAADDGHTICVAPGRYLETLTLGARALALVGVGGPHETVIDGGGMGPVVTIAGDRGDHTRLQGFTLSGGVAEVGGGLAVKGSSPTLRQLRLDKNRASSCAGGWLQGSAAELREIVVAGNEALSDGGGLCVFDPPQRSAAQLDDIAVISNRAGRSGGGLLLAGGAVDLRRARILGNVAGGDGGGLYAEKIAGSWAHLHLGDNEAAGDGGGALLGEGAVPRIEAAAFTSNRASGDGGGLSARGSAIDATAARFLDNQAGGAGGAIAVVDGDRESTLRWAVVAGNDATRGGGIALEQAPCLLLHATVVGNGALEDGGGLRADTGSPLRIGDTVFAHNLAAFGGGGLHAPSPALEYAQLVVHGNHPGELVDLLVDTPSVLELGEDPSFVDIAGDDPLAWDLRLRSASPLRDAGGFSEDPDGSAPDIGAFGGAAAEAHDADGDGYPLCWTSGAGDDCGDCDDLDPRRFPGSGCGGAP